MAHIIVTGGTRGIGRGIVADLATDHHVTAFFNATEPRNMPVGVRCIQADLTNPDAIESAVAQIEGPIDGIVNNAGTVAPSDIEGFDPAPVRTMFELHCIAPALLLAAALPRMAAGASVVNISSVNADFPPQGSALYGASKAAMNNWTRGAAKELGPKGIRVNAVAPGATNTPEKERPKETVDIFLSRIALGRMGEPDDIAAVTRFLLSDAARYVTGEIIRVSGGYQL
ncbi:MAG: SDR family oxidoreductase [Pseudomonadota bacterium]